MCGIIAVFGVSDSSIRTRNRLLDLSKRIRHRGPDWSGIHQDKNNFLMHERLAIIDPTSGDQPLYNEDGSIVVTVNGEIYNHVALKKEIQEKRKRTFRSESDCEVIAHLYEDIGENFVSKLDGMFAFVVYDKRDGSYLAARDPIGITTLYMGYGRDGSVWFASELKALKDECERFEVFKPGHVFSSKTMEFSRWYNPKWLTEFEKVPPCVPPQADIDLDVLREKFEKAVVKRMMSDVPFGVLLSGGLDSSLVASICSRHMSETNSPWGNTLHSFSVGLPESPDLMHARNVAKYLGTKHHEFHFTVQEGIDAINDVIYHLETFDVTTVRASTPMFLMSRKIKSLGVKMVLSGEGSDEIFGGYLYFHKAPNREEFHEETCRKVNMLYLYDCLRANKSTSAWGIEARVPFLDREFLDYVMSLDPTHKLIDKKAGRIEKYILRKAFDTPDKPYLPNEVLYRQKEQFSDGVGYSWIDGLKEYADVHVSDTMLSAARHRFPESTPQTKEAYLYREIFESHYPQQSARMTVPGGPSVACSTPTAIKWDAAWANLLDPSGRAAVGVHDEAYEEPASKKIKV